MALQAPHRKVTADDLNFRCSTTASEGMALCYSSTAGYVEKKSSSDSAVFAGILMTNVEQRGYPDTIAVTEEDWGTSSLPRNYNKNVTYTSGYVRLLKIGEIETDQITAGETPTIGSVAYVGANGNLSTGVSGAAQVLRPVVGHFLGAKDSNGFAKVWVNVVTGRHLSES